MTWTRWKIEKGQVVPDTMMIAVVAPMGHYRYVSPPGSSISIDIGLVNYSSIPITVILKK